MKQSILTFTLLSTLVASLLVLSGCAVSKFTCKTPATITKKEVLAAQEAWGAGIVAIGKVFQKGGDFEAAAVKFLEKLYAYGENKPVLFKPTLATDPQFRDTFEQALSYFVGGEVEEDTGFALKPYSKVRFDHEGRILIKGSQALAMGKYFFTPTGSNKEIVVEYTFVYARDDEGNLRIHAHHSSLPFKPNGN